MRFDGHVGFPGGLIEEGEEPINGLIREMDEEINYRPQNNEVCEKYDSTIVCVFNFFRIMIYCLICQCSLVGLAMLELIGIHL